MSVLWELVWRDHRQYHRQQQKKFQMDMNKTTAGNENNNALEYVSRGIFKCSAWEISTI